MLGFRVEVHRRCNKADRVEGEGKGSDAAEAHAYVPKCTSMKDQKTRRIQETGLGLRRRCWGGEALGGS